MKALLYKDFLIARKYLRTLLVMDLIFVVINFLGVGAPFFSVFPMVTCSALVTSLISYDERMHVDRFCDTTPVSRRTQVDEKYLVGLLSALLLGLICALGVLRNFPAASAERVLMLAMLPAIGLVPMSLLLPLIFRLGSERGRIYYYLFYFGGLAAALFGADAVSGASRAPGVGLAPLSLAFSLALYAVSWRLSVRFFERRELS